MSLRTWGWNGGREEEAALPAGEWKIGRVIGQGRGLYTLTDGESVRPASVSGAFSYRAVLPADYPVTGDFVAFRAEQDTWVIEQVLPRRGVLSRKAAGNKEEEQVLAANVDTVFLVFALDGGRGFHPRLLERLLTIVQGGGAVPVILLNKADAAEDGQRYRDEAEGSAPGVDILLTSALTGQNVDLLRGLLLPGQTYLFLGKSGVGKSSLINRLFGEEITRTSEIRDKDKRGRHTTSSRELFLLPNGALLMDTPGLREAALLVDESALDDAFPDIASLAEDCRFRDCSHSGEPGCAVQEALVEGSLDYRRYESYLEYRREARYHRMMGDRNAQRLERLRWKKISKLQKDLNKDREDRR